MTSLLHVRALIKAHGGLRPLRLRELDVQTGDVMSIVGLDQTAAEVLVHLATGATLPDQGEVRTFGQDTRQIDNVEAWLRSLDTLGVLSPRTVLIDPLSVRQNLAIPFTLEVDPIPVDVRPKVDELARLVGLDESHQDRPIGAAGPVVQSRVRLARAVALQPTLVIAEHPSVGLPPEDVPALAADLRRIADALGSAILALTMDARFSNALGGRTLTLNAATGELHERTGLLDRLNRVFGNR